MKSEKAILDATPSKRIYRSIIADYGLVTAISELVDNVIDSKRRSRRQKPVSIQINIDCVEQSIVIIDDAGGIRESDLGMLITPGASHTQGDKTTIGIFGVGSKRATVALAREIKVATRFGTETESFQIEYDDDWLGTEDWRLPYYRINPLKVGTTRITLTRLRSSVSVEHIETLKKRLSETFARFIRDDELKIQFGDTSLVATEFDNWSYPPEYEPRRFEKTFRPEDGSLPVKVTITSGLTLNRGSTSSQYGVYVYCNNRLILRAARNGEFGFRVGEAGVPHPSMANSQVVVEVSGAAKDMPWNSSKTGLNFNHSVFKMIQPDIVTAVRNSTALSRRFWPAYEDSIAPHKNGCIRTSTLPSDGKITASKLPPVPSIVRKRSDLISEANRVLSDSKPWVVGAYESIEVVEVLKARRNLQQRNRIILIVLDSMLEIAFKDYLAHDIPEPLGEAKLKSLFSNRLDVHKEVEKTILTGNEIWKKIDYFYKQRCELIHKRVSVVLSDSETENFQRVAETVLEKMFCLKFPSVR